MDGKNDCFQEEINTDAGQYNGCEKYGNSFVVLGTDVEGISGDGVIQKEDGA